MSAQNRYQIARNYKSRETEEWVGWRDNYYGPMAEYYGAEPACTWRDAIQGWLDRGWASGCYTVVSETPSEDGQSGTIEIQFNPPRRFCLGVKIKATLIEETAHRSATRGYGGRI